MTIEKSQLVIKDDGPKRRAPPAPAGTVPALCVFVEDLGMQTTSWQGETKIKHQLIIGWELAHLINVPDEPGEDPYEYNGKPYLLTKTYNFSLAPKAGLRLMLESWRGKKYTKEELKTGLDVRMLVGKQFLLNIVHSDPTFEGKVYANIANYPTGPMKDQVEMVSTLTDLPSWVVEKKKSGGIILADAISQALGTQPFDDVPF